MFNLKSGKLKWGLIFIGIGSIVWAHNYGLLSLSLNFSRDWPVILIGLGLFCIWKSVSLKSRSGKTPLKGRKRNITDILEDVEKGNETAKDAIRELNEGSED